MTDPVHTSLQDDLEAVTEWISVITGIPTTEVVPEASLVDDLCIDSIAKIELVVACEKRFAIQISDDEITDLSDVRSVLACLAKHREQR